MAKKKTSRPSRQTVRISVDDAHLDRVSDVVKKLKDSGVDVDGVMEKLGTVTGSVDATKLKSLSSIPGVAHVEKSSTYQLPPPDSDVQ